MRKISLVLAFLLFVSGAALAGSSTVTVEDVDRAMERTETFRSSLGEVLEKAKKDQEAQKKALESYQRFKGQVLPKVEEWRQRITVENGKVKVLPKAREHHRETHGVLQEDERLYIFMSSSVPKAVWKGYAEDLDNLRDPNAVMVLRGCIGGCRYIKPTLEFIQSIVAPEGEEGKKLFAQVWIDPYLFRFYGIREVPCVVFARGVHPIAEASEGTMRNLRGKPTWLMTCGDWALEYHLKELYKRTKAPSLKALIKALRRSWYAEGWN